MFLIKINLWRKAGELVECKSKNKNMEILEKLFGSSTKVKIIKLFLFNKDSVFDIATICERSQSNSSYVRKEIHNLEKAGFLKSKMFIKEVKKQKNRRIVSLKKKTIGWMLDIKFPHIEALETFLASMPLGHKEMAEKIARSGKIQLLIVSGLFIKNEESRADLLVVGDNLKQNVLDNIIKSIESEIGKEIRYASFETSEFRYRHSMFDKLIRDILDYPHEKIINKIGL